MQSEAEQKANRKEQIRRRYQGGNSDLRKLIPAVESVDFYNDQGPRRVAVYVRVSTDSLQQTSSYELQKNYYENFVRDHANWSLVEIYADEGITGTSLSHRDAFNQMIADCKSGQIDMIITKSVSRFSRNIVDCISTVRDLAALKPPVGVYFETEHLFTLDADADMKLGFISTMAQEESHTKSTSMNASIEMRFSNGILLTPAPLGYDNNSEGRLIVNKTEAQTVRLIFFLYLYGYSCEQIAQRLSALKYRTKKGNTKWSAGSVLGILRNERYCGDVMARKSFTPNYLDHKSRKNTGQRNRYYWKNQQEPIVSRDDFIAVQRLLQNAKYGNKGIMPELKAISRGNLKGFVWVNIHWAGFTVQDYIDASSQCQGQEISPDSTDTLHTPKGVFDLSGFEVACSQCFDRSDKLYVTFSVSRLLFSQLCIRKMSDRQYVELLVHPKKLLLAVRISDHHQKNAVKWAKLNQWGDYTTREIRGVAFLKTLYELFEWNSEYKYRLSGVCIGQAEQRILLFDVRAAMLLFPTDEYQDAMNDSENVAPLLPAKGNYIVAFPEHLVQHFGASYYEIPIAESNSSEPEQTVSVSGLSGLQVTSVETVAKQIQEILRTEKEEQNGT